MSAPRLPSASIPAGFPVGSAVALGSLLLAALLVWAALTPVDVVVTAPAAARLSRGAAELRAPESRVVARVTVAEGQRVTAGMAIIELDDRALASQRRSLSRSLALRQAQLADARLALEWLREGAAASAPAESSGAGALLAAYRSRRAALHDELQAAHKELEAAVNLTEAGGHLLAVERQRLQASAAAHAAGAISDFDLLAARQTMFARQAELDGQHGRVAVLRERVAVARTASEGVSATFRGGLLESVADLQIEVEERRARLAELDVRWRDSEVRTPVSGVVDRTLVAAGDYVQRGEVLALIVPDHSALRFEARIPPAQMAFLRQGQPCRLKLEALPFARYGAVGCRVTRIGNHVVLQEGVAAHYLASIEPAAQTLLADGKVVAFKPGATALVDIVAGRRTVLSFVTEPLRRFSREALRER